MARTYRTLTEADVNHFVEKGHIILQDCFPRELAEEWRAFAFKRLGYDPDDPTTWKEPRIHMPSMNRVLIEDVAPRAWDAICDLLGGEDRIISPGGNNSKPGWSDGFIINFALGARTHRGSRLRRKSAAGIRMATFSVISLTVQSKDYLLSSSGQIFIHRVVEHLWRAILSSTLRSGYMNIQKGCYRAAVSANSLESARIL